MVQELCSWLTNAYQWVAEPDWASIRDFSNSTLFTTIVGAFFGAWGGGRIAQILANRAKDKADLTSDIRNANAAATLASSLCDDLSNLMAQHVRDLKKDYDEDLARFIAVLADPAPAPPAEPTVFVANLQYLSTPSLNTETLQSLVFGQISNNFAIKAFSALDQAITNVKDAIAQRNAWIKDFEGIPIPNRQAALKHLYFGQPHPTAGTDERYKALLGIIHDQLKDGIYFSMHLSLILCEHSAKLAKRYRKKHGRPVPKAQIVNFGRLAERGLLPDRKDYPDWDVLFYPSAEPNWWQRLKRHLSRVPDKKK